jgi:2-amino-4-hydroxy-6-hydroxymethyldihydropteridine diphosphokinase
LYFGDWYPYYLIIARLLNIHIQRDFLNSLNLSTLKPSELMDPKCFRKIQNNKALVIGAGPSIEEGTVQNYILEICNCSKGKSNTVMSENMVVVIAADGATEMCLDLGIIPDFVVTDLDGDYKSLTRADSGGSVMVVHAHGDNFDKITTRVPNLSNVIGTTQNFPLKNVYNFGGFTDGDRSVSLAVEFLAREILLVGMDFDSKIGFFSKRKVPNLELKKQKLQIGKYLVGMLLENSSALVTHITTSNHDSSFYGVNKYKVI